MKTLITYNPTEHGQVNKLDIAYSIPAPTLSQATLQLKNHLIYLGRALQNVSWLDLPEKLVANGPDVIGRTAKHMIDHAIPFTVAGELLGSLKAAGKIQLSPSQQEFALQLLGSKCHDISSGYDTGR